MWRPYKSVVKHEGNSMDNLTMIWKDI